MRRKKFVESAATVKGWLDDLPPLILYPYYPLAYVSNNLHSDKELYGTL